MSDIIKTSQFAHQRELFELCKDREYFAVLWEMGLGKSKLALDVASHLFARGKILQLIVLSPHSVYTNWTDEEVPTHLAAPHVAMAYPGDDAHAQAAKILWMDPNRETSKLRVLSMSYESLRTHHGLRFAMAVATIFPTMIVADESTCIKSPSAVQTKRAKKVARLCPFRYILTGTPAAQSPFDLHSQIQFLDDDFWGHHGVRSLGAFKREFGVAEPRYGRGGRQFLTYTGFRRLDELREIITPISSRLLKEDSGVELPPKLYRRCVYRLTPEQRRTYEELRARYEVELEGGEYVEASMALTRLLRLQQISSGFVLAADSLDEMYEDDPELSIRPLMDPDENPRLAAFREIVRECAGQKAIAWCKFTPEVALVSENVDGAERYDGSMTQHERDLALRRFKDPRNDESRLLAANFKAMAYGKTVVIAKTVIYFSNDYSLERRLQSEDRCHRIGQDSPVLYVDLVGEGTVDEKVVAALRSKYDIAAQTTGDRVRQWISRSTE